MAHRIAPTPQGHLQSCNELRSYVAVRALILLLVVAQPLVCSCQLPVAPVPAASGAPSDWQRVEHTPPGTSIRIKARSAGTACILGAVDDNSLTCAHGARTTFARTDIVSIVTRHRGRSALILGGVGAGVGVAVVKLVATVGFNGFFNGKAKHVVYAGGAGLGVLAFAPIGFGTDFTHSTIYKAP